MTELRDGSTTTDPKLDRLVHFDPRSRDYPISAVVPEQVVSKTWLIRTYLNQGSEGACVAAAFAHEAAASPMIATGITMDWARQQVYWEAQKIDRWAGGSYPGAVPQYEGTAVIAGAKVMQRLGFYDSYRWAFTIDDVLRAIGHEGPVVFGVHWREGMFDPRPSGLLDCTGRVAGGHAILGRGVTLQSRLKGESTKLGPVVRLQNSWGKDWGHDGSAFIRMADLEVLLKDQGECCCPVGRHVINVA